MHPQLGVVDFLNQPIMRLPEYPVAFPYSFYPEVFIFTPSIHPLASPDPCRGALGRLWLGRRFCDVDVKPGQDLLLIH